MHVSWCLSRLRKWHGMGLIYSTPMDVMAPGDELLQLRLAMIHRIQGKWQLQSQACFLPLAS